MTSSLKGDRTQLVGGAPQLRELEDRGGGELQLGVEPQVTGQRKLPGPAGFLRLDGVGEIAHPRKQRDASVVGERLTGVEIVAKIGLTVASEMRLSLRLSASDTVAVETPASRATSLSVGFRALPAAMPVPFLVDRRTPSVVECATFPAAQSYVLHNPRRKSTEQLLLPTMMFPDNYCAASI